jgi:aminoglycoside phosphotransferase (APT) family kinase protein
MPTDRWPPEAALSAACAQAGLSSDDAQVLYARSNTVYKLGARPVVARLRYAPGSAAWHDRLDVSVRVTAWLHEKGFPCVRPLEVGQPVSAGGYLVTFWHYLPDVMPAQEDVESLALLLRQLHALPAPPFRLPPALPLSSLPEDTRRCQWLPDLQRSWLLARAAELEHEYVTTQWSLGRGLIHCDAWAENLIRYRNGVVLADWDSVSYGPREQDIVPSLIRQRFGRPAAEWDQFCRAYGVEPHKLPGLGVLREMRELRTLVPYLRSTGLPQVKAEVARRIGDLMSGTQSEPWHALNLAS